MMQNLSVWFEDAKKNKSVMLTGKEGLSRTIDSVLRVYCTRKKTKWVCDVRFWRDGVYQNGEGEFDSVLVRDANETNGTINGNFDAKYYVGEFEKGKGVCAIRIIGDESHSRLECDKK